MSDEKKTEEVIEEQTEAAPGTETPRERPMEK